MSTSLPERSNGPCRRLVPVLVTSLTVGGKGPRTTDAYCEIASRRNRYCGLANTTTPCARRHARLTERATTHRIRPACSFTAHAKICAIHCIRRKIGAQSSLGRDQRGANFRVAHRVRRLERTAEFTQRHLEKVERQRGPRSGIAAAIPCHQHLRECAVRIGLADTVLPRLRFVHLGRERHGDRILEREVPRRGQLLQR